MVRFSKFGPWEEYDFSPSPPPRTRRRQTTVVPHFSSNALPGPNLSRQAQSFDSRVPVENAFASPGPDLRRRNSPVLSTADLLSNFRPPEVQPVFKVEPLDEDIMKLPLRSSKKFKTTEPRAYGAKPRGQPRETSNQQIVGQVNKDLDQNRGSAEINNIVHPQSAIVDLTGDDGEERARSPRRYNSWIIRRQNVTPYFDKDAASNLASPDNIPGVALRQVREGYRREGVSLPTDILNWQQLESFAKANDNRSRFTLAQISRLRAKFPPDNAHPRIHGPFNQPSSDLYQGTFPGSANREPLFDRSKDLAPDPQTFAIGSGVDRPGAQHEIDSPFVNRPFFDAKNTPDINARYSLPDTSVNHETPVTRLRTPNAGLTKYSGNPPYRPEPIFPMSQRFQAPIAVNIDTLMQPSKALPDLLPASTPTGHPHLVSLWHPNLLRLPKDQHNHLDLVDTAVSIMFKYDMKEQNVIKAFFDTQEVQHFFFLFKSRTSAWHSWSIEREHDVVTIGLERNNRAANTTESQRPSSGQFDVTVQYRMNPPRPAMPPQTNSIDIQPTVNPDPTNTTTEIIPPAASNNAHTGSEHSHPPHTIDNTQIPVPSSPPVQASITIPGQWHLHATTIFASQPPLPEFLWNTPPNRGADEISRYHHPTQSHVLPPSHLTILARYLQHTAFTCTAVEAEFQVAWGRKVRYDSVLGRVRATYDYALKGAKTQAEKRKRGEYNRPVGKGDEKKTGASTDTTEKKEEGTKPGAGETREWLAGRDLSSVANADATESMDEAGMAMQQDAANIPASLATREGTATTIGGMTLRDRARRTFQVAESSPAIAIPGAHNHRGRSALDESATIDDTNNPNETHVKEERPKKRLKRENRNEASGSEYSESSSDEE